MAQISNIGIVFSPATATVDVMLETKLDALIQPNTSMFIPRTDDELLENCFWNGILGAEPGHPILARAIENAIRVVLLGTNDDDDANEGRNPSVERYILESSGTARDETEIWKLRAVAAPPEDYVFGGCALGVAANQVLKRRTPVEDFAVGMQPKAMKGGDLLILLVRLVR